MAANNNSISFDGKNYDPDTTVLYCSNDDITEIPKKFTKLEKLYISKTKIKNIPSTYPFIKLKIEFF